MGAGLYVRQRNYSSLCSSLSEGGLTSRPYSLRSPVLFYSMLMETSFIHRNKKSRTQVGAGLYVRQRRFELPHPFGRYHLKVVRLPISPSPQLRRFNSGAKVKNSVDIAIEIINNRMGCQKIFY
jgi:hypothetical protein